MRPELDIPSPQIQQQMTMINAVAFGCVVLGASLAVANLMILSGLSTGGM